MEAPLIDREITVRMIVLGTINTGKSSLIYRLNRNEFLPCNYSTATLGVDFNVLTHYLTLNNKLTKYKLQIFDAGGQDSYINIVQSYYRTSLVAIIMYDISDLQSFIKAKQYVEGFKKYADEKHYLILVGNKTDLDDRRLISYSEAAQYADNIGAEFIECSVKRGVSKDTIFNKTLCNIDNDILYQKLNENDNKRYTLHHKLQPMNRITSIIDLNSKKKDKNCCVIG